MRSGHQARVLKEEVRCIALDEFCSAAESDKNEGGESPWVGRARWVTQGGSPTWIAQGGSPGRVAQAGSPKYLICNPLTQSAQE